MLFSLSVTSEASISADGVDAPLRVAYVTSRFPSVTETFILRELNAVTEQGVDACVLPLFPTPPGPVHDAARRWESRTFRASPGRVLASLAWWLRNEPAKLLAVFATVARGHAGSAGIMPRAIVTAAIAAHHARWIKQRRIHRVHAHFASYGALAAWCIHRLTGTPYSFTAHAHDLFMDQRFLREKVHAAEVIVAISDFNRRFLSPFGGDAVTPVAVVRCGIDVDAYPFEERVRPAKGSASALCVASFQDYKGHAVLLEALARHGHGLEGMSLTLVGQGPLEAQVRRQAAALGLTGRIRFTGALREQEVLDELMAADLFVLPSIVSARRFTEGVPVALMEAMACGLPVVATEVSGVPELVRDGDTGLLARPADPGSLASALRRVIRDPDAARMRARRARVHVQREFDIATTGPAMAALLRGETARSDRPVDREDRVTLQRFDASSSAIGRRA
jgi:colanic acid/amylovoran biosynthesis glycosyltransferase